MTNNIQHLIAAMKATNLLPDNSAHRASPPRVLDRPSPVLAATSRLNLPAPSALPQTHLKPNLPSKLKLELRTHLSHAGFPSATSQPRSLNSACTPNATIAPSRDRPARELLSDLKPKYGIPSNFGPVRTAHGRAPSRPTSAFPSDFKLVTYRSKEVPARLRGRLAVPPTSAPRVDSSNHTFSTVQERLLQVTLEAGTTRKALEAQGAALSCFHRWCDFHEISDKDRIPLHTDTACHYAAYLCGKFSARTVKARFWHLQDWHTNHRIRWSVDRTFLEPVLNAAKILQPDPKMKRRPFLTDHLLRIQPFVFEDPNDISFATCFWSCVTFTHQNLCRLGETTVESRPKFNPRLNCTGADLHKVWQPNAFSGVPEFSGIRLHLPHTKTQGFEGENIPITAINHPTDCILPLHAHLSLNKVQKHEFVWTYVSSRPGSVGQRRPLTKKAFIDFLDRCCVKAGLPKMNRHSLRIGGTTQLLMNRVPPQVVQAKGRWTSDAFMRYWRHIENILVENTTNMVFAHAPEIRQMVWTGAE